MLGGFRDFSHPAFAAAVAPMLAAAGRTMPAVIYSQAQRWGSAMPAPRGWEGTPVQVMGATYQSEVPPLLPAAAEDAASAERADFVADDGQRLYYAGDFCSSRAPGFEAAALSGFVPLTRPNTSCATAYPAH